MDKLSEIKESSKKSNVVDSEQMGKVYEILKQWEPNKKKYEEEFKHLLSEIDIIRGYFFFFFLLYYFSWKF
jgi:hypothetical protein